MGGFQQFHKLLEEAQEILAKTAYSEGGVSSTATMSSQLGETSATVLLTDGLKPRKKRKNKRA